MQLISCQYEKQSLDCSRHFDLPGGGRCDLPNIGHFVAPTYLGKVTQVFPFTPSGLEMAFKRSVWGVLFPPPQCERFDGGRRGLTPAGQFPTLPARM